MDREYKAVRCTGWRKLPSEEQLKAIYDLFKSEVKKLEDGRSSHTFKCFYECTENRQMVPLDVDMTNRPAIFSEVIRIIKEGKKITGEGLPRGDTKVEQMHQFAGVRVADERVDRLSSPVKTVAKKVRKGLFGMKLANNHLVQGRSTRVRGGAPAPDASKYVLPDIGTPERADWFLDRRIPTLESPTLIVTHQDFMKEVIKKLKKRRMEKNIKRYPANPDEEIPNLGILHLEVNGKHIFLMRHCFACHNIKDKNSSRLGDWIWATAKKARHYNYGELSVCIQEDTDYVKAVEHLKKLLERIEKSMDSGRSIKFSLSDLHFGCSPLFRAMFTLIKVLQGINKILDK